ncbi:MAG TPA: aspartyl protease family protein [Candidatus Binatia bacterium]|nr:aspartyl protease family protein [Candidatus Binatia bacterium]
MSCRFVVPVLVWLIVALASGAHAQAASSQPANPVTQHSGITIQLAKPAEQKSVPPSQTANAADESAALAEADRLFATGKTAEAAAKYQAIANADPESVPAQVGVIRTCLMEQKLDEAQSAANTALALHPESPLLLLTLGDVQFAQGRIPEAERSYVKAQNLTPDDAAPYLGLARVYRAYSLYRRAYDNMKRAHELAPNDLAVQLLWFHSLPPQEQIPALEDYLANAAPSPQMAKNLQQYLAFLKRNAEAPVHACRLVSRKEDTETKLYALPRPGTELGASGLLVKINKDEMHLALDTGSGGVLLGRAAAEKLGLQRLAYQPIVGMGDSGQQGGYTAVADRIRIGDLEFQDCVVRVTDAATPVSGQDGLIGTDVFSAYLIDIDIPGEKLRLSPLPKRPDAAAAPAALQTMPSQENQDFESQSPGTEPHAKLPQPLVFNLPRDAYVAPGMANWTKVYRFRSLLLVPTRVDNTGPMLFLMDTGSFSNVLSTRAARQLTQIRQDPGTQVRGISGAVSQVYRADKATLQFGRYAQQGQDIVTFDLSNISRQVGTQVSGILGFNMLRILQIKIDYRDGLVDFLFDPNHLPRQVKLNH